MEVTSGKGEGTTVAFCPKLPLVFAMVGVFARAIIYRPAGAIPW
jgi:hypothetical protein